MTKHYIANATLHHPNQQYWGIDLHVYEDNITEASQKIDAVHDFLKAMGWLLTVDSIAQFHNSNEPTTTSKIQIYLSHTPVIKFKDDETQTGWEKFLRGER